MGNMGGELGRISSMMLMISLILRRNILNRRGSGLVEWIGEGGKVDSSQVSSSQGTTIPKYSYMAE